MEHKIGEKSVQDVFVDQRSIALASAACEGDLAGIDRALRDGAVINGEGHERTTALMWALTCDNAAGIEHLLKAGANPNLDNGRFTPVYAAATRHNPVPLKILLRYGGDANTEDRKTRKTALEAALSLGIHGFGWDNYYTLLEKADINRADEMGWTIANAAAALNQFDKVAELLERGYSFDLQDLGRTVQSGRVDLEPQVTWQHKVRAMLVARGVVFPVPPKVRSAAGGNTH